MKTETIIPFYLVTVVDAQGDEIKHRTYADYEQARQEFARRREYYCRHFWMGDVQHNYADWGKRYDEYIFSELTSGDLIGIVRIEAATVAMPDCQW